MGGAPQLVHVIQSLQSLGVELAERLARLEAQSGYDVPTSDPTGVRATSRSAPGSGSVVKYGRVIDSIPFLGWYRVFPEDGDTPIGCCLGIGLPGSPIGVRRVGALPPLSRVHYVRHGNDFGVIIAVEPGYVTSRNRTHADWISSASTNSPAGEQSTNAPLQLPDNGVIDFSNGGLLDETAVGETGALAETAVGYFADPFMAFIRADENCGLWAFYLDQLVRLSGRNLQIRSAGREDEQLDDEGEFDQEVGSTPYPWEALGVVGRGTPPATRNNNEVTQRDVTHRASGDTVADDQVPFYRSREYGGYLGQGYRRSVVAPGRAGLNKLSDPIPPVGVYDEQVGVDGTAVIRTAQGFTVAHVPAFPVATRIRRPEDGEGDGPGNYDAAGSGGTHRIRDNLPPPGGVSPGPASALTADDDLAYSRWRADHPFHYHERDWTVPDGIDGDAEAVPDFATLKDNWWLDLPEAAQVDIDHRFKAAVVRLVSMLKLTPDGGVVIAGGQGEEIRLIGGSIEMSAPGDISLRPARNAVTMAGRDAVVRAHGSAEMTAAHGDVRIKADGNTQITAGNSGTGALVLEGRSALRDQDFDGVGTAVAAGGVIVRARNGVASILADEVYIRSGADGGSGPIVLDAAKGMAPVVALGETIYCLAGSAVVHAFGRGGEYGDAAISTATASTFPGDVRADGEVIAAGGASFGNSVAVVGGHVFTEAAASYNNAVPTLSDDSLERTAAVIRDARQAAADAATAATQSYSGQVNDRFYDGRRIGGDVLPRVGFSFRTSEQCGTGGMEMLESRWQQRARLSSQDLPKWDEPALETASGPTRPWPGNEAWEGSTYRTVDLLLYDVAAGRPRPAGSNYENPSPPAAVSVPPKDNYLIVG